MTGELLLSVAVCTLDRPRYLRKALAGLAAQTLAPARYEVLVIDNGPSRATAQVVREFSGSPVPPRCIDEPKRGLSHARNRAWREARGAFVAYLDDDAVPHPRWLEHAANELDERDSKLGMLGGRVIPIWEAERPAWLSEKLQDYLTMVDLGPGRQQIDALTGIVGANMIVPRHLLEATGGFSPLLGRKGRSLLSNEELYLKRELAAAGYHAVYVAEVAVEHHAPRERLSRRWFLRRLYWQGRSDALIARLDEPLALRPRAARAKHTFRQARWWFRRWLDSGPRRPESFEFLTTSFYNLGFAVGELVGANEGGEGNG